ncbi:Molybdopterin-binding protein [gamma proteobacterium HdN1]|nr:Molybdopterin-binding protein [gamma proteobacterium HdN1]
MLPPPKPTGAFRMNPTHHPIELQGSVWMTIGGENFGGPGRVELLARIAECGSITQAAKAMKMSYKAAWDAIESMNALAGEPLVVRMTGGKGGGGTRLTPRGEQLVENFRIIEREHRQFIEHLASQAERLADDYLLLRKMGIKTSARNLLFGTIREIVRGAVNDELVLEIRSGLRIVAIIPHDSAEELGLALGSEAFALIPSASVMLATPDGATRFSARNQLRGTVTRLLLGAVNTDVTVEVAEGMSIAAVITNESSEALGLAEGRGVSAIFNASAVIIGVPG